MGEAGRVGGMGLCLRITIFEAPPLTRHQEPRAPSPRCLLAPPCPLGPKVLAFQTWGCQSSSGPKGPGPHLPTPVPFQIFRSLPQT